uniref:substrate-binding domain-containing protein n=1 Tax=Fodinicola feengrottensis TaxID=435914 RepID=UPI0036F32858
MLTALDVLGYERPTQLRGERAKLVGLVVPELQNPIFPAFADVMGNALAQRGFTPVLCTGTAGGVSEADHVDLLLQQHVSGVVFAGGLYTQACAPHQHYRTLLDRRLPTVLVNAAVDGLDFPRVSCDDAVAAEQALGHLLALGHRRVGLLLGPPDHVPSQRKLAAFRERTAEAGIPALVEHAMFSLEGGQAAATRLLRSGVTAVICASDPLALGAIRAVRRAGMRCPTGVSVIGYDDSSLMTCVDPPLTTIRQPIEAMGYAAVELLATQLAGGHVPTEELLYEPELVVRGSTAPVTRTTA